MTENISVYKNHPRKLYNITEEKRAEYRKKSLESRLSKLKAERGLHDSLHLVNKPKIDPSSLMPILKNNDIRALSLFSGGGGLDLGFDNAGYEHVASYKLIPICGETLKLNKSNWNVFAGSKDGDVTKVDWTEYLGKIDIIHGGPPCQPFFIAGEQKGKDDERNMWGEFTRAINKIKPAAFVAENVLGLLNPKFNDFMKFYIYEPLSDYKIIRFEMDSADFGIPQIRRRVFFVGFRNKQAAKNFVIPEPTHSCKHFTKQINNSLSIFDTQLPKTMGVREALGLVNIKIDFLAPTIRSGFTGKRNTTSILNSAAGQKAWSDMRIWPNGVQLTREKASNFPALNGHFRLSTLDVGLIQGFPSSWFFAGAVYQILGQIGNSVSPVVAYQVAKNVSEALQHN